MTEKTVKFNWLLYCFSTLYLFWIFANIYNGGNTDLGYNIIYYSTLIMSVFLILSETIKVLGNRKIFIFHLMIYILQGILIYKLYHSILFFMEYKLFFIYIFNIFPVVCLLLLIYKIVKTIIYLSEAKA